MVDCLAFELLYVGGTQMKLHPKLAVMPAVGCDHFMKDTENTLAFNCDKITYNYLKLTADPCGRAV